MASLQRWSTWIACIAGAFVLLCLGLLIDDELRITAISADLDQADQWLVDAFMRTKRTLRISVVIESLLLLTLIGITLRVLVTHVREPLRKLRKDLHRAGIHPEHVITPLGPVEIRDVATDAERMRRALVSLGDIATKATFALALEAPTVSAVRDALDRNHEVVAGVAGYCQPIEGVIAGDWWWAAQRNDGSRVIAIADVSGHGVQAGVMAIESRAIVATALSSFVDLPQIAYALARHRWDSGMFLTLFMAVLSQDYIEYCSCGAPFALLTTDSGFKQLLPTGPVLSNLKGDWTSRQLPLSENSMVLAATDGLTDASDEEEILEWVRTSASAAGTHPQHLLDSLIASTRHRHAPWNDDLTVMIATGNSRGVFH